MSNPALNKAFGSHVQEAQSKYYGEKPYGTQYGAPQQTQSPQFGTPQYGAPEQTQSPQFGAPQYGQPAPSSEQLEYAYNQPAAEAVDMGRMTMDDVVMRTLMTLATVIVSASVTWWFTYGNLGLVTPVMYGGLIVGLVLGLVNAFKKEPSPPLILGYAVAQGAALGALSMLLEMMFPGIVMQAVLATLVTAVVTALVYKSGLVKVNSKFIRYVTIAMLAYLGFVLVNLVLMVTNVAPGTFGLRSGGFGLAIGALAVLLATFSLMIDFKMIEEGVKAGVPSRYAWSAAFGITVTLLWLYIEILRIIAILRSN